MLTMGSWLLSKPESKQLSNYSLATSKQALFQADLQEANSSLHLTAFPMKWSQNHDHAWLDVALVVSKTQKLHGP